MKKLSTLLFIFCSLFFIKPMQASHIIGGEVSWKCQGNGQYIFYGTIYRDCRGAGVLFTSINMEVTGAPLPMDSSSNSISKISLEPDSSYWIINNKGDLSPNCANPSQGLSCANMDGGAIQAFYYKSKSITLKGTPPANGWHFTISGLCCRPLFRNFGGLSATPIYTSAMFSNGNATHSGCMANAPVFAERPVTTFCTGNVQKTMSYSAEAIGADSIKYYWDQAYNGPVSSPVAVGYRSPYSKNNPLPGIASSASKLDSSSGMITLIDSITTPLNSTYGVVVRADAYKNGKRYASTKRELPINLMVCAKLTNNKKNNNPDFYFNNVKKDYYEITVKAGTKVTAPVKLEDLDSANSGNMLQKVRLLTNDEENLARDRIDTAACANKPCAVFKNNTPQYDTTFNVYLLEDTSQVSTTFEWQTMPQHLDSNGNSKTYYFRLYGQDEICPLPGAVGSFIKVTVEPLIVHNIKVQNNTLIAMDSLSNYQWFDCIGDSILPGETNRQFKPNHNGSYAFISSLGNYSDTSKCFPFTITTISENSFVNQLQLYPNPTNQNVKISFGNRLESVTVKVRNIQGQLLQEENYPNTSLIDFKLRGEAGIYFLEIKNAAGETANLKVMKKE